MRPTHGKKRTLLFDEDPALGQRYEEDIKIANCLLASISLLAIYSMKKRENFYF